MSDLEMLLSLLLTKNPAKPVILHIDGDTPQAEVEKFKKAMKKAPVTLPPGQTVTLEEKPSDTVTIPMLTYQQLVTAATMYDILERSYHTSKYGIDSDIQRAVFAPSHYKE